MKQNPQNINMFPLETIYSLTFAGKIVIYPLFTFGDSKSVPGKFKVLCGYFQNSCLDMQDNLGCFGSLLLTLYREWQLTVSFATNSC